MAPKKRDPKQQADTKGAWCDPAELKRCENPTHSSFWYAEPAWNQLALLGQAWKLVAKGLKP